MIRFKMLLHSLRGSAFTAGFFLIFLSACSKTVTVQLPPQVDLSEWPVIGAVDFTADKHGELARAAAKQFLIHIQSAQPGVRILELGDQNKLLQTLNLQEMNPDAMKAIGRKFGVQAVFTGELQITEATPNVSFSRDLSSARAGASLNGNLDAKLQETATGATVWSNGAHGKWAIGGLTLGSSGLSDVGYTDPKEKYDEIIRELTEVATNDFRPRYEKRKAD